MVGRGGQAVGKCVAADFHKRQQPPDGCDIQFRHGLQFIHREQVSVLLAVVYEAGQLPLIQQIGSRQFITGGGVQVERGGIKLCQVIEHRLVVDAFGLHRKQVLQKPIQIDRTTGLLCPTG